MSTFKIVEMEDENEKNIDSADRCGVICGL